MRCIETGLALWTMLFIASIHCDDCPNIKHYEELGCKEINVDGECCATR